MTAREHIVSDPILDDVKAPVLAVMWCCSVGVTWTLELRRLDCGNSVGTIVDWISSGVPICQPEPAREMARKLLAERGFHLFQDSCAGPNTRTRHSIGYVYDEHQADRPGG